MNRGTRAERSSQDNVLHYFYDGSNITAIDSDKSGTTSFFMAGAKRVKADSNSPTNTKSSVSYIGDGKSNVMTVGNNEASGSDSDPIIHTVLYGAYGQTSKPLIDNAQNSFTYNGEYQDPDTNLVYLRARDYNPGNQRFMSMDSYNVWNKYNFADANPLMNVDPSGHMPAWLNYTLGVGAIVGGLITVVLSAGATAPAVLGVMGAMMGVASGSTQIASQVESDKGNESAAKTLAQVSLGTGIAGLVFDVGGAVVVAKNAASKASNLASASKLPSSEELRYQQLGDDFYIKDNVIGYTQANKGQSPTIYFKKDDYYGHITQEHNHPDNVGREYIMRDSKYEFANQNGRLVEASEHLNMYHKSRSEFIQMTFSKIPDPNVSKAGALELPFKERNIWTDQWGKTGKFRAMGEKPVI